jgi:hypothetical protein
VSKTKTKTTTTKVRERKVYSLPGQKHDPPEEVLNFFQFILWIYNSLCILWIQLVLMQYRCSYLLMLTERAAADFLRVIVKTDTNKWNGRILVSFLSILYVFYEMIICALDETCSFEQLLVNCEKWNILLSHLLCPDLIFTAISDNFMLFYLEVLWAMLLGYFQ